jgi:hypothetical protein
MMDSDIIKKIPGYSDRDMYHWCRLLENVVDKKEVKKVKVGNKYEEKFVLKFNTDLETKERIHNSVKYYRSRMEDYKVEFRDYQKNIIDRGTEVIMKYRFLYLAMEVRTGKTLTSLGICDRLKPERVLFVTKKKAISSIEDDYDLLNPSYDMETINYESLHKINHSKFDIIILDEAHTLGAYPKPSKRAQQVKDLIYSTKARVILLSGTPTPESYSQMYHQVYGIPNNPFNHYKSFYRFADKYVDVKQKKINSLMMNDYDRGKESIIEMMKPYTISYSQKEAGFATEIEEEILTIPLPKNILDITRRLKRDLVVQGKDEVILGDTPTKLMQKVHQLCSGTIKFESGKSMVLSTYKAEYIKDRFKGKRIGIFYKFKEELNALKQVFSKDELTTDLSVFKETDCQVIALQIVSGREGISLRDADYLVYYNIDFSATSYWQSRDRMTTKERTFNKVYWIFSKEGIEQEIYKTVIKKKDYTTNHFKKDLLSLV